MLPVIELVLAGVCVGVRLSALPLLASPLESGAMLSLLCARRTFAALVRGNLLLAVALSCVEAALLADQSRECVEEPLLLSRLTGRYG